MNKLRIGVMGCASIARRSMIPAIKSLPDQFELVAVASRTKEKAAEFATLFDTEAVIGYDTLVGIGDIDAIYMPLPTGLHEDWILQCLESGKHVLVEKSLALDYDSACRIVEVAKRKNLLVLENFMFKYHRQHQTTRQILAEGQLGDIRLFRSQFGFPPLPKDNFRYDKLAGGGSLLDAGAYTVKASQLFLGAGLEVVAASLYFSSDGEVDLYGNATLINKKGVVSQVAFGFDNFYQCNYEFWGSKGNLKALRAFTPKPHEEPEMVMEMQGDSQRMKLAPDDHFRNILLEFFGAIQKGDHLGYYEEIVDQSRILTEIRTVGKKILI